MAFERYRVVTGDDSLEADCGLTVLVETARLWMSLGHHDRHGVWHLDGVTGPDEYTAVVRDNVFTNLMAAHNLRTAAQACSRHPDAAYALGVSSEETAAWRDAADAAHIPYDDELRVHQQCEGFTSLREWNFTENTSYPLLLHEAYVRLYPSQVIKQADLALAMHWGSHGFTPEQKARNVDYYERRTTRDSSLSACTQAVMCAEVGHLELAHDYLYEAALIDLRDLHHNTRDGLHMASLAGAWTALVAGFGGLRDDSGELALDPQLPDGITRLRFRLRWRGFRLTVDVSHDEVSYALRDGPANELTIRHAGERARPAHRLANDGGCAAPYATVATAVATARARTDSPVEFVTGTCAWCPRVGHQVTGESTPVVHPRDALRFRCVARLPAEGRGRVSGRLPRTSRPASVAVAHVLTTMVGWLSPDVGCPPTIVVTNCWRWVPRCSASARTTRSASTRSPSVPGCRGR